MKQAHEIGDEVFIEDGRKAVFAGEIDGQKFVRVILARDDEEYSYEEWPSEKLTPVGRLHKSAPTEIYASTVEAIKSDITKLRKEAMTLRSEISEIGKNKSRIELEAKKYPDIQTALDFIEGRITHLVKVPGYSTPRIMTLEESLKCEEERNTNEMCLLSLFGKNRYGKQTWKVNRYYDGSGSWTEMVPFKSESDATDYIERLFDAELALWRRGDKRHKAFNYSKAIPEAKWPKDWSEHVVKVKMEAKQKKIAELQAKIAEIETPSDTPSTPSKDKTP